MPPKKSQQTTPSKKAKSASTKELLQTEFSSISSSFHVIRKFFERSVFHPNTGIIFEKMKVKNYMVIKLDLTRVRIPMTTIRPFYYRGTRGEKMC